MSEGRLGQGQPELLARGHNQDDSVAAQGPLGERVETRTPGKTQASPGVGQTRPNAAGSSARTAPSGMGLRRRRSIRTDRQELTDRSTGHLIRRDSGLPLGSDQGLVFARSQ